MEISYQYYYIIFKLSQGVAFNKKIMELIPVIIKIKTTIKLIKHINIIVSNCV